MFTRIIGLFKADFLEIVWEMTINWIRYFFVLISKWLTVFFDQFYHFDIQI